MGNDRNDAGQFEWVNSWAESARPESATVTAEPVALSAAPPKPVAVARSAPALPADQLMRDIAEIERVRDALAALPIAMPYSRRTQALTLVPSRTTDPVPVVIGGVLALVMLTVFGAAAAMTKFAR
jgi:hypothetical protein